VPIYPSNRSAKAGNKGTKASNIRNSLTIPSGLKEFWYPATFTKDLTADTLIPVELFGTNWVVFRDKDGAASCIRDECAHRACPLSLGTLENGEIACAYHGWAFDGEGKCTKMPSTTFRPDVSVDSLRVREGDGFVWIWTGDGEPDAELPDYTRPPEGFVVHCEQVFEVPTEHGLLLENLLDLAHAPFTHTQTFAKGWPIPDAVKFRTQELLGGNWEPYPIDMSFKPPCGVLSTIGVSKPGDIKRGFRASQCERHLWQLHVCLPSTEGKTRLLYRMGLDFWEFTKFVPFMEQFWKQVADQVLSEDLVLIQGQQARMERGANVWANPVSYDKLAVRYRRWRNSMEDQDEQARRAVEAELQQPFSAGELFKEGEAVATRE
jgi:chlorophyllide a oxygenase